MEQLKALTDSLIQEMRRNTEEVVGLRNEQKQVLTEHVALRRANRRERRWRRIALLLVLAAVAGFAVYYHHTSAQEHRISAQQSSDLTCVGKYEDAQRARQVTLLPKSNARNTALRLMVDAQFKALTYARTAQPDTNMLIRLVDDWNRKTEAFRHADDAYNTAVKANPVPAQVFTCSDRLKTVPGPTSTATATATRTATVTVPGSTGSTVTVPGPTATVQMPGVTRTVVVREPGRSKSRTVTTTKAPPDCLTHPVAPCTLRVPTLPRVP